MNDDFAEPLLHITPQCVVALTWTLKDTLGEELDVLQDPVEFLVGGGDLLPKMDEALQGHAVGDVLDLHLEPEDAFGDFIDKLIFLEPRSKFPKQLEVGMGFEGLPAGCNPDAPKDITYNVTDIYPEHVVVDGNHPLAGIAIRLHLKIASIREATEEEIGQGSAGVGFFKMGGGLHSSAHDDGASAQDDTDAQYRTILPGHLKNMH